MQVLLDDGGAVSVFGPGLLPSVKGRGIPIRHRDGTIRTYVLVDPEDYEWAMEHRWHIASGCASRNPKKRGGTRELMHRAIFRRINGREAIGVDHISGDPLDNRRGNLREATQAQNLQNMRAKGGTSRYRGVTYRASRSAWVAQCQVGGKMHYLGCYDTELEAAEAAAAFRRLAMPYSTERGGPADADRNSTT